MANHLLRMLNASSDDWPSLAYILSAFVKVCPRAKTMSTLVLICAG